MGNIIIAINGHVITLFLNEVVTKRACKEKALTHVRSIREVVTLK